MRPIFWIFILVAAVLNSSCNKELIRGAGSTGARTLTLPEFTSVESHYDIKAIVSYGSTQEVTMRGYENLLGILDVSVENGILRLKYNTEYNTIRNGNIVAYIKVPVLSAATIHGSEDIEVGGFNSGSAFDGKIHGSGNIRVANSTYQSALLEVFGSGSIEASGLQVKQADVNIHGSGHTTVSVSDRLKAGIYGSGNVYYLGTPSTETAQHGTGRVVRR